MATPAAVPAPAPREPVEQARWSVGHFPRMKQALVVDSVSSVGGAFMGTSSVTAYIESSSGVAVGGRTGLTAIVVGILFLLAIFFSPVAAMVPAYAAAGLIYVGVLMCSELTRVREDLTEAVPWPS